MQVDDAPPRDVGVRTVRTIKAQLSKKSETLSGLSLRAQIPDTTRFLDLEIEGDENRFVERTLRITRLPADEATRVKAALIAAIPAKRGRVT